MNNIREYIESGLLEAYVLGLTSEKKNLEITELSNKYPEIKAEIDRIVESMINYAESDAGEVNPLIKPMVLAIIDYTERIENGEAPASPPVLNPASTANEYSEWLDNKSMVLPSDFTDIHARIIGFEPKAMTAIVWIKEFSPYEVHNAEFEKFLIVEGTCDIIIEGEIHSLVPGDYLSIPLHAGHEVKVTSSIPCKVILQRIAA